VVKLENAIKLTEEYSISSDGRMNLILHERFEKKDGRGKDAKFTGEFAYRDIGYFRNLEHVANHLVKLEVFKYEGSELKGIVDRIEELNKEIKKSLVESDDINGLLEG